MSKGVALVTGSGSARGIGRAISLRLADDGFDVAVTDIPTNQRNLETLVEEIKAKGRKSCSILADVTQEEQVKMMVETVVRDLGGLDVMIANAGVCPSGDILTETSAEDFQRTFDVNTKAVFFCYKYAGKQMIAQGRGGRILAASSSLGKKAAPFMAPYCASKFAVRGLTQSLAQELGPHGITVNAYCPGPVDTELLAESAARVDEKQGRAPGTFMKMLDKASPLGYKGAPVDIASVVAYLASKEAHFITGQSITVDGGVVFD
ncbi:NAD(P)-binding protein [Athelia psychrophila]|uniref:NAD(P)-binding protein n=1 Tax=Athelia psychrophila TaxID=1759441 RepID=A0A166Q4R2_9AGAM|nr:NAD(P)-binding protein [Fibularhizoctonia sp. CBS 109695]